MLVTDAIVRRSVGVNIALKYLNLLVSLGGGLFLVPISVDAVGIEQYGVWLTISVLAIWFATFDPGVANLLIQKISSSYAESSLLEVSHTVVVGFFFTALVVVSLMAVGIFTSTTILSWLALPVIKEVNLHQIFLIVITTTAFSILMYTFLGVLQGLHRSLEVGILLVLCSLMRISGTVYFLSRDYGLWGLAIAPLLANMIIAIYAGCRNVSIISKLGTSGPIPASRFKSFGALFLNSFGSRFSKTIVNNLDNILIAKLIGVPSVAIFNIIATPAKYTERLISLPLTAFRPSISHFSAGSDHGAVYCERLLVILIWGSCSACFAVAALGPSFISLWMSDPQLVDMKLIYSLSAMCCAKLITSNLCMVAYSLGYVKEVSYLDWVFSAALLCSSIPMTFMFGLQGLVLSHTAANMVVLLYLPMKIISRHFYWGRGQAKKFIFHFFTTMFAGLFALTFINEANSWLKMITFSLLFFGIHALTLSSINRDFREMCVSAVTARWGPG